MNVGITDLNRDGFPDVYISNIATMVKDDKYAFPDAATAQHFTANAMATLLFKESKILYMSRADDGALAGYEPSNDVERGATSTGWAWDAEFFDFDLDGDDDLYVVNGANDYFLYWSIMSLNDGAETRYVRQGWGNEPNVFFVNEDGRLTRRNLPIPERICGAAAALIIPPRWGWRARPGGRRSCGWRAVSQGPASCRRAR